jgi:iron complex outermembrane receptor protein
VGASGDLKGVVLDATGAVMQNVAVVVVESQKGCRHTASTEASGRYRIVGLSPGSYDVSAAIPGFQTLVQKAVMVNLGDGRGRLSDETLRKK